MTSHNNCNWKIKSSDSQVTIKMNADPFLLMTFTFSILPADFIRLLRSSEACIFLEIGLKNGKVKISK
jgi:hypothetical protein